MSTTIKIKHIAMNVFNAILAVFFGIYAICGRTVSVGLASFKSGPGVRHGVAHVVDIHGHGGIVKVPFVVDKPENLINMGWLARQDMIEQIEKMGFEVRHIEIEAGGVRKVFAPEALKPMLVQTI